MKKGKKFLAVCMTALLGASLFTTSASAELFGGTIKGGVKNRQVYYDPSVAKYGYTEYFDKARAYWNGGSSSVKLVRNYGTPNYNTDRYVVSTRYEKGDNNTLGFTQSFRTWNGVLLHASDNVDWVYSAVLLYKDAIVASKAKPATIQATATHEVGHSLKIDHHFGPGETVMRKYMSDVKFTPTTIKPYDKQELIRKWGK